MQIIKNREIIDDPFTQVSGSKDQDLEALELPDESPLLVSLPLWRARRSEFIERPSPVGVILEGKELLDEIIDDLSHLSLVALDFPHFRDGRAYSKARLLRERHGFDGEIRAVGDVHHDQLHFMERCGFDAYEPTEFFDLEEALQAFDKYTVKYQPGADEPNPLFRQVKR